MNYFFEIFFYDFFLFLKVQRPGRKTSDFQTVRILKMCCTSRPDCYYKTLKVWSSSSSSIPLFPSFQKKIVPRVPPEILFFQESTTIIKQMSHPLQYLPGLSSLPYTPNLYIPSTFKNILMLWQPVCCAFVYLDPRKYTWKKGLKLTLC